MKNTFLLIIGLLGFGINGMAQFDVVWTDLVGVTANGNNLTRISSGGGWNSGAFSENKLNAGDDGYLETTINETNTNRMIGFSTANIDNSYTSLEYAIFFRADNKVLIYENGVLISNLGNYSTNQKYVIEKIGNVIYYKRSTTVLYTSASNSTSDLYVDTAMLTNGSTLTDVRTSFDENGNSGGDSTPGSSLWSATGSDIYYNTGNVGIGNDAPASLLHITAAAGTSKGLTIESGGNTNFQVMGDGRVFAREVEVTLTNFPDYVFAKDYTLMPLGQLKNYINKNHHLPNIPSAEEIEENGIGMGELNLKQVEKIEELTLYILQLDERLQKLEVENETLKQQLQKD